MAVEAGAELLPGHPGGTVTIAPVERHPAEALQSLAAGGFAGGRIPKARHAPRIPLQRRGGTRPYAPVPVEVTAPGTSHWQMPQGAPCPNYIVIRYNGRPGSESVLDREARPEVRCAR